MNNAEEDLYLPEKSSVLGELSSRMRQAGTESYKNRRDDEDFLPPPPVFETFNPQLSEKDDVDDLPPPPTPLQSGNSSLSFLTPRPFITPSPYQSPPPPIPQPSIQPQTSGVASSDNIPTPDHPCYDMSGTPVQHNTRDTSLKHFSNTSHSTTTITQSSSHNPMQQTVIQSSHHTPMQQTLSQSSTHSPVQQTISQSPSQYNPKMTNTCTTISASSHLGHLNNEKSKHATDSIGRKLFSTGKGKVHSKMFSNILCFLFCDTLAAHYISYTHSFTHVA